MLRGVVFCEMCFACRLTSMTIRYIEDDAEVTVEEKKAFSRTTNRKKCCREKSALFDVGSGGQVYVTQEEPVCLGNIKKSSRGKYCRDIDELSICTVHDF